VILFVSPKRQQEKKGSEKNKSGTKFRGCVPCSASWARTLVFKMPCSFFYLIKRQKRGLGVCVWNMMMVGKRAREGDRMNLENGDV
jgi:hypothetical protein